MQLIRSRPLRARPPRRRRRGLTLIELLIVIVLLGIVAGGMMQVIVRQQQFYNGSSGVLETRSTVREGLSIVQSALRGLSPANGDILAMGTTFLEFKAPIGASVLCQTGSSANIAIVPPRELASGAPLTAWATTPKAGDIVLVYDSDRKPGTADDTWDAYVLTAAPTANQTCPTSTGFTTTSTEAAAGWGLSLSGNLQPTTVPGASIRILRRTRYELFQAVDGRWYIGYRECQTTATGAAGPCSTLAPVAGPFLPPNTGGLSGLELRYFDATGAATTDPTRVARIDILLRAQSARTVNMAGRQTGLYQDSLAATIAIRN